MIYICTSKPANKNFCTSRTLPTLANLVVFPGGIPGGIVPKYKHSQNKIFDTTLALCHSYRKREVRAETTHGCSKQQ